MAAWIDTYTEKLEAFLNPVRNVTLGIADANRAIGTLDATARSSTGSLSDLTEAAQAFKNGLGTTAGALADVGRLIPGLGPLVGGFADGVSALNRTFDALVNTAVSGFEDIAIALDVPQEYMEYDRAMLKLNQRFGGTIAEAKGFGDALRSIPASDFGQALYINTDELQHFADQARNTNITMEQFNEAVSTAAGETNVLAAAYALGASAGQHQTQSAKVLNELLNQQAMSGQDAVETFASFIDMSSDLGIAMDKVASTLNSVAHGFMLMGVNARFGEPILRGFGDVMERTGLPIEAALTATTGLSQSLANLASDYGNAYLVMQSGGLDLGQQGGMLGSGIALQQAMRNTDDQGELSSMLAGGMRDMLARFGGGQITTLDDASADPSRNAQLFTQQQLLGSQFNIQGVGQQNAVLDLLSELEAATAAGDSERADILNEQIARATENKDETVSNLEKISHLARAQVDLLFAQNRILIEAPRRAGELAMDRFNIRGRIEGAGGTASEILEGVEDRIRQYLPEDATLPSAPEVARGASLPPEDALEYLRGRTSSGTTDNTGVRTASVAVDPQLARARTMGMEDLARRIEAVSMQAAAGATRATLQEGGFANRTEFAQAIATQLAAAMAEYRVPVDISFTDEGREIFIGLSNELRRVQSGGGTP